MKNVLFRAISFVVLCGTVMNFKTDDKNVCFVQPFWPMGTGIARGFLAAMDSAWMVRSWAQGASPLEVLAER